MYKDKPDKYEIVLYITKRENVAAVQRTSSD